MALGTVAWFHVTKGFGFIKPDDGEPDVFVHVTAVRASGMSNLTEGQRLAFDLKADTRTGRLAAANLSKLEE